MLSPDRVVVPNPIDDTDSCVAVLDPTTKPTVSPPSGLTERRAKGVVVPTPTLPKKYDVLVVVAIKLPTVSCVPVAISAVPFEFDVMMEFGAKDVLPVPPFGTLRVPVKDDSDRQVPEIA